MDIWKATEKDIPGVCDMLTSRMVDSKEASFLLDGIIEKKKLFKETITLQIEGIYRVGEIYIAGDYQGVLAGLYGKNSKHLNSLWTAIKLYRTIKKNIPKTDFNQLKSNMKKMAGANNIRWCKQVCGDLNFYYIQLIAIDRSQKGNGIFRKLITPVLMQADHENMPVLLDTHDVDNVSIYEHFGFNIVKEHHAKGGEPIIQYSLIRR